MAEHVDDHLELLEPNEQDLEALAQLEAQYQDIIGGVPPGMKLRFLRACGHNCETACQRIAAHQEWYAQTNSDAIEVPAHCTGPADSAVEVRPGSGLEAAVNSGYIRYLCTSSAGNPVTAIQQGLWNPHEYDLNAFREYLTPACLLAKHLSHWIQLPVPNPQTR